MTTRDSGGQDIGLTASSFNSVSLNPPMVLWSLARQSLSLPAFLAAEHFAVHVLAATQDELAQRFATRGADKFTALAVERGCLDLAFPQRPISPPPCRLASQCKPCEFED